MRRSCDQNFNRRKNDKLAFCQACDRWRKDPRLFKDVINDIYYKAFECNSARHHFHVICYKMKIYWTEMFYSGNGLPTNFLITLYVLMGGGGGGGGCNTANYYFVIYRTCAYVNRMKLSEPILQSFLRIQYGFHPFYAFSMDSIVSTHSVWIWSKTFKRKWEVYIGKWTKAYTNI